VLVDTGTVDVHASHTQYAAYLGLLAYEPHAMKATLMSRSAVHARNNHLIVNTAKSEAVHFTSAGGSVPYFIQVVLPLLKGIFLGMFFRTLNLAKAAELQKREFSSLLSMLHLQVLKGTFSVRRTTTNWTVLQECGHAPLLFNWFQSAVKHFYSA